ncbi:tyrosinase family protein [Paraburkholderia mimosarum]|uniref:tyrosinase family protein n=1 Tax=Paraburkholderia mimosarum TaxID=312026 RepID=UPI0039C32AE9
MALGDGIRRNIKTVDPAERAMLRDAIKELNNRYYPGSRSDTPPGGVSWWFKQDEIHQATHVHGGPEFLPWHREITNRFEALIREINPQLSLHYWDFKEDPRALPNANLGGGNTGTLNLFDPDVNVNVMGSPGLPENQVMNPGDGEIGDPWKSAGFYDPLAGTSGHPQDRNISGNPVDPPQYVTRPSNYPGPAPAPLITLADEKGVLALQNFGPAVANNHTTDPGFVNNVMPYYFRTALETIHNRAHPYFADISPHDAFRDPFVFLLHSNVDRIYAMWQCDPMHPERLDPNQVYGLESNMDVDVIAVGVHSNQNLTHLVEPWSTGHGEYHDIRPWEPTHENQGSPHDYHDLSVVAPPCYDTLPTTVRVIAAENPGNDINFNDVPQGETASRAAVFEIFACDTVTLQVKAGSGPNPPYSVQNPPGDTIVVTSGAHQSQIARLWFQFTGGAPGPAPVGSVTIHCVETNQDFVLSIHGNSIMRPTVGVMLVLDQSGSMGWLAGVDATTKRIDVLHQAATNFCQLVQANNGVGMVSFDQAAYPGFNVTTLTGAANDPNLMNMVTTIDNLQPQGATSIGNGIALGRTTLSPVNAYLKKAMIVFTDGLENTPLYIADVMGSLDAQTFAIGLGTAQQVSAGALDAITSHTGGYVLLSGPLSPSIDDQFRLRKYFLQVLAGVSNTSIVTDPNGTIFPGAKVRIPFQLSEADIDATAILLTDHPGVNFYVETPAGDVMTPASAAGLGAAYGVGTDMSYYRFTLPLALGAQPARAGTWYALLEIADRKGSRWAAGNAAGARSAGIRYSFTAQSFTNIRMDARLTQNSLQPGATVTLSATLTEYGVPVEHRANVSAELELPDNTRVTLALSETAAGRFQASTVAVLAGVYRVRLVASGLTMRGVPFTREQLLSATAILGGDNPLPTSGPSTKARDEELCRLIQCLLGPKSLGHLLLERGVDPKAVASCFETWCKARLAGPTAQELAEREGTA